jgi:hypothetical protein
VNRKECTHTSGVFATPPSTSPARRNVGKVPRLLDRPQAGTCEVRQEDITIPIESRMIASGNCCRVLVPEKGRLPIENVFETDAVGTHKR